MADEQSEAPSAATPSKSLKKTESIVDGIINPFHIFGENKDDGGSEHWMPAVTWLLVREEQRIRLEAELMPRARFRRRG